jgi:hypothetical protein
LLSLDPLSAIVQEEDAKMNRQREIEQLYERDRRRNKGRRGPYIPDEPQNNDAAANAAAYEQLITKDLLRLSSPHQNRRLETTAESSSTVRVQQLKQILYLFSISHPEAGYIQGMHEIASYCLYVLEIEEYELQQRQTQPTKPHISNKEALCYWFTEYIITSLYTAYDVANLATNDTSDINNAKSLSSQQQPTLLLKMSNRILQSLSSVDATLYSALLSSSQSIPYQLIFTKWIRLLFSREVTGYTNMSHADTVVYLWDALLEASGKMSQQPSNNNIPFLQIVAESFCVARIWHHTKTIQHLHWCSKTKESNFLLHWFMNIPPESMSQVQNIIHRMNYIIDLQYNNGMSPTGTNLQLQQQQRLLVLPPLDPIPPDVLAMTQLETSTHYRNAQSTHQQPSDNTGNNLWDGGGTAGIGSSFFHAAAAAITSQKDHSKAISSFTESIAAKTQSLQKMIAQEWENVQSQLADHQTTHDSSSNKVTTFDQSSSLPHLIPSPKLMEPQQEQPSIYNLNYYGTNTNLMGSSDRINTQNSSDSPSRNVNLSERLQRNLKSIHSYVVEQEQRQQSVNTDSNHMQQHVIWDALADLQLLQQQLHQNGM